MSGVVSFGEYTFPKTLMEFDDNFADMAPITTRMPGLDGGFNEDGELPANSNIGKVTVGFQLEASTRAAMDDLRDAVSALASYGLQQLIYQPTDSNDSTRYCWARVNYIQMSERKDEHSDLWQKVQVIFQVPYPRWLIPMTGGWKIGDAGVDIGDTGLKIGAGGTVINASGLSTTQTLTYNGNAPTIVKVFIEPQTAQSCQNPKIQRLNGALVVDQFRYEGTISAGSILAVDGKSQAVTLNAAPIWDNFTYMHQDFFRLEPGITDIKIIFANSGDAAKVRFMYEDEYR